MTQDNTKEYFEELLDLADSMAANATVFKGQGYGNFINSREEFKTKLDEYLKEIENKKE